MAALALTLESADQGSLGVGNGSKAEQIQATRIGQTGCNGGEWLAVRGGWEIGAAGGACDDKAIGLLWIYRSIEWGRGGGGHQAVVDTTARSGHTNSNSRRGRLP